MGAQKYTNGIGVFNSGWQHVRRAFSQHFPMNQTRGSASWKKQLMEKPIKLDFHEFLVVNFFSLAFFFFILASSEVIQMVSVFILYFGEMKECTMEGKRQSDEWQNDEFCAGHS